MRPCLSLIAALALIGCNSEEPTARDIEHGYLNFRKAETEKALEEFGSIENLPPGIELATRLRIQNIRVTSCEENPNDIGYICVYNVDLARDDGFVIQANIANVKGHVYQVDAGWMVEEIR